MARQFRLLLNTPIDHFERVHAELSDDVISHVLPRRPTQSCDFSPPANLLTIDEDFNGTEGRPLETPSQNDTLVIAGVKSSNRSANTENSFREPSTISEASVTTEAARPRVEYLTSCRDLRHIKNKTQRMEMKKTIRREQCRTNQARYRNRQRVHQNQLQQKVQHLREELQSLRLKRQRLRFSEKTNRSPWAIASEVFRLLECSFRSPWHMTSVDEMMKDAETRQSLRVLQKSFTHDVAMGNLSGMDALLDQLRRYSLYFGEPHIQLKRVESVVPGVLMASARLSVTVSEFTLRFVFPHLEKPASSHDDDEYRAVREKLLGQRLDCNCELVFLMDEESGRVERLETSVNLMKSLFDVLKSVEGVVDVMEQAFLTPECLVGDLVITSAEAR
ncbi:hypothetical protein ON010_g9398 [Phytophthora cinnamomi]|nr:hypothetical protein ON010_g9398 [Phytophthora cinnamomi]